MNSWLPTNSPPNSHRTPPALGLSALLFLVLTAGWLSGCGLGPSIELSSTVFGDEETARFAFENLTIDCDEPGMNCPSYVGALITYTSTSRTSYSMGKCSGTLISEDQFLTNRHCLPDDLQFAGANCLDRIGVIFPETRDHSELRMDCQSVHSLASDKAFLFEGEKIGDPKKKADVEDWAIINLQGSTSRPPVPVSLNGLPHGTRVVAYPTFYESERVHFRGPRVITLDHGNIRRRDCTISQRTSTSLNQMLHEKSTLYSAICDFGAFIGGTSGSGIFTQDGLAGLHSYSAEEEDGYDHEAQDLGFDERFTGGTNAFCISTFNPHDRDLCLKRTSPASEALRNVPWINKTMKDLAPTLTKEDVDPNYTWVLTGPGPLENSIPEFDVYEFLQKQISSPQDLRPIPYPLLLALSLETVETRLPALPHCIDKDRVGETLTVPIHALENWTRIGDRQLGELTGEVKTFSLALSISESPSSESPSGEHVLLNRLPPSDYSPFLGNSQHHLRGYYESEQIFGDDFPELQIPVCFSKE